MSCQTSWEDERIATVLQNRMSRVGKELATAADKESDRTRALTAQEAEWKQRINERLLSVLDLSLIDSVDSDTARE